MHRPALGALALLTIAGCTGCDGAPATLDAGRRTDAGPRPDAGPDDPSRFVDPSAYEYDWTCTGEVPASAEAPSADPPTEDCSDGVWPNLSIDAVCPTITDGMLTDPDTGAPLPPADSRTLPTEIPISESGSFLPTPGPSSWPSTLRIVVWNTEYTANLDAQLETLTTHPELRDADVYLLSEVDRCSARNGTRRAARMLAQAVGGEYVYGIEFVELSIGRTVGGDTGQAIVSRRPLTGARLLCHSAQFDWFTSSDEPRLGSRVALHGDVPIGDTFAHLFAIHLESNDGFGELRAVQTKEILDAAQASACDRPTLVAGDFNAWYPTAPEVSLLRNEGFVDALDSLGDTDATHESGRRLDYAWARGMTVVAGAVLRDVSTSDHYPMWIDVTVP
ncbi:MAG: endonuclease/exonuclease/phosphatase family protein [Sandaracinaceae bacterium]